LHGKYQYKVRRFSAETVDMGSILFGMRKIGRFFDQTSKGRTIESSVPLILLYSVLFASGINDLIHAHKRGNQFGLYWGGGLAALSLLAILWISFEIRAAARRRRAEAES
jgi:hypothetical protein